MKKGFVLGVLFILPLVAYLFFASGVNHFSKLPVLEKSIGNLDTFKKPTDTLQLENKISVVGFIGENVRLSKGNLFNLNQKIYNYFYEFSDFQMVMLVTKGYEEEVKATMEELDKLTDTSKWHFVYGANDDIFDFFESLNSPFQLDNKFSSSQVFIIDKKGFLRGRDDDEEILYGYDAASPAEINGKMKDDVKVILAEYRLELKKYNKLKTQISE